MGKDNSKYPEWQKHLRELQAQRDDEVSKQIQAAIERDQKEEAEREVKAAQDLETILGFLGFKAEPKGSFWTIGEFIFLRPELYTRTQPEQPGGPDRTEYKWSVVVSKPKDKAMVAWYEDKGRNQYNGLYDDPFRLHWPTAEIETGHYVANGDWSREKVVLADAFDRLDEDIEITRAHWAEDQKVFEVRKERAEWQAREREEADRRCKQAEEEAKAMPSLEARLLALLREFVQEAARIPEY